MKQPKKLTRAQKIAVSAHNLNADNWSIIEETEFYLKKFSRNPVSFS